MSREPGAFSLSLKKYPGDKLICTSLHVSYYCFTVFLDIFMSSFFVVSILFVERVERFVWRSIGILVRVFFLLGIASLRGFVRTMVVAKY